MSLRREFLKIFSASVCTQLGAFLLVPVYLNLMTEDEFGIYSYIVVIGTFVMYLASAGQQNLLIHFRKANYNWESILKNILKISLCGYALIGGLILFSSNVINFSKLIDYKALSSSQYLFCGMCLFVSLVSFFRVSLNSFFSGIGEYGLFSKYTICLFLVTTICSLFSLWYFKSNNGALNRLIALLFSELLMATIFLFFAIKVYRTLGNFTSLPNAPLSWQVHFAIPLTFMALVTHAMQIIDRSFIQYYGSFAEVGRYTFAIRLMTPVIMINANIQTILFKVFYETKNVQSLWSYVVKIGGLGCFLCFVVWIVIYYLFYFLDKNHIELIPESYYEIRPYFLFISIASSLQLLFGLLSNFVRKYEFTYVLYNVGGIVLIVNILGNFCLVPNFGEKGAAIATVLSFGFGVILMVHKIVKNKSKLYE